MIFNFNTFNHCPQGIIVTEDITKIMGHQIISLGHWVNWSNDTFLHKSVGYNMIIESFADPGTIPRIAAAYATGCRFIYIATEEPTAKGFNHGLDPAMIERQNAFPSAARYADGILHLIPGNEITAWYSQFAPAAYAELGFAQSLLYRDDDTPPAYLFGFFGKMTWRREKILGRLEEISDRSILRIVTLDVPRAERDAAMRQVKVVLQIRANDEWGMLSNTRCAAALLLGRPVIAEPHPIRGRWNHVVHFSRTLDSFYSDAFDIADNFRDEHRHQVERFKQHLTPEWCIGRPLREIGCLSS